MAETKQQDSAVASATKSEVSVITSKPEDSLEEIPSDTKESPKEEDVAIVEKSSPFKKSADKV